jgi:hypothetical protein
MIGAKNGTCGELSKSIQIRLPITWREAVAIEASFISAARERPTKPFFQFGNASGVRHNHANTVWSSVAAFARLTPTLLRF